VSRGARTDDAGRSGLRESLHLIVITDRRLAAPRSVEKVVAAALDAGAGAVQLRDKYRPVRETLALARALRELTRSAGALLFINDRLDVALAAEADGVHVGPDDLPVEAIRRIAPPDLLVGASTDDPLTARRLAAAGADYLGCGAVFGTRTKDVGSEAIGLPRLDEVARAVSIPVVGIGGVTPEGGGRIARETRAAGVACVGAVMAAPDPGAAVRSLLAPFRIR
jgi:thiamine-phosphate pyrophosphorylase